jgi:hypothetical protein
MALSEQNRSGGSLDYDPLISPIGVPSRSMVTTYHTERSKRYPRDKNAYHDREDCPAGRHIKPKDRENGTGRGRRLCEMCEILDHVDDMKVHLAKLDKQIKHQLERLGG